MEKTVKIWGTNKHGQLVKEHDKLFCGNGLDTWFTHVIFYEGKWHRESDYNSEFYSC